MLERFLKRNHRITKLEKEFKKVLDAAGKGNENVQQLDLLYCDITDANHGAMRGITKDGKVYGFLIVGGSMTMVMMKDYAGEKKNA